MLDNTDTFYLVSGGQAGGGTRERNVYDTRGTDVLSVLRVNCALASSRERRPVHRLLRGLRRAVKDLRARVFIEIDQPAQRLERSSGYYRCSKAQSRNFGGVADMARALSISLSLSPAQAN